MITRPNGTRYKEYDSYNKLRNQPYNYERDGLCRRIMSSKIWSAKNPVLRYVVGIVDQSLVFCLKVGSKLEHFYNYNHYNR